MLEPDRWYTTQEIAEAVGVNVETVRRWVRSGRLPARQRFVGKTYEIRGADVLERIPELEQEGRASA